jgi:RHS repeat-associated protein
VRLNCNRSITKCQTASLRYMHPDQLGSVAAISDGITGQVIERLAYDPWGKRRDKTGTSDVSDSLVGLSTDRGFTEHEHLDEMGIIHMNGRIYDPLIGRFMSADPFIQAPSMLQSYNRYSYVMNNPLNLTDPSGFSFFDPAGIFDSGSKARTFLSNPFPAINNFGDRNGAAILGLPFGRAGYNAVFNFLQGPNGYQVKSAAITFFSAFCGYAVAACNGGGQAALAKAYGASDWDAFNTGGIAALSTGLFQAAGSVGGGSYVAHAAAGCVSSAAGGGNCGQGALAAVFGKYATDVIGGTPGQFDAYQFAATVVAGGVGSVIGGGKFQNGAATAAYGYLYNHVSGNSKGRPSFWGGVKDGVTSYTDGLAEVAVHRMALSGAFGETVAQQARGYANTVSNAIDWAAQNLGVVARGLYVLTTNIGAEETRYIQAKIGARVGFGSFVSVGTFGVGAVLVPTAAYGNMLEAAKKGASYIEIIKRGGIGY